MMEMKERKQHINYALAGLSMNEKRDLVQYTIAQYKLAGTVESKRAMSKFMVGQRVTFQDKKRGTNPVLIIEKIGSKCIVGRTTDGTKRWKVPAYLCEKVKE